MNQPHRKAWMGKMAAALVAAWVSACTPNNVTECAADDQCTPGQACRNNRCEALPNPTDAGLARMDASVETPDASTADAAMQQTGDAGNMGGPCQNNDDGILTSEELPLGLNVEARFLAASSDGGILVDLVGTPADAGMMWDLSAAIPGEMPQQVVALPLTGTWFGPEFPDGQYYVPLDGSGDTLGIYKRTPTEVLLLGVASKVVDKTLLKENPPVAVLKFPLSVGTTFTTTTTNSGTLSSNPFYTSTDTYAFNVDARGRIKTPAGEFSVLRVRVEQTVQIPFLFPYKWVRYSYVAACYSQVANVASVQGETELLFTHAAEVRRLGLP
jgi:hypothetical protein